MTQRYSLHKLYSEEPGESGISPIQYSKFKYGDKDISRQYGFALATGFIKEFLSINPITEQIVVVSSPYAFIPTATYAMKNYFVQKLNEYLVDNTLPVVQETKIHRTVTYKEDYGALSAEERMKLISKDAFHIDKDFIKGKTVLYLDDIRITGSHEKVVERMIQEYNLDNHSVFLYFAELMNDKVNPAIENELNYAFVTNLLTLNAVITNGDWIPNTRAIKFILDTEQHEADEFRSFISYQPLKILQTIYHLAIGNSYHTMDSYNLRLTIIRNILKTNHLL